MCAMLVCIDLEFIEPCLPCVTMFPPSGEAWLHEIKHPGQRLIARRGERGVRLFGGCGEDWTSAFPFLVESMNLLPVKSYIIDGDLVRCDAHGNPRLDPLLDGQLETGASLYAFDLLEVNGFDLRRDPIEDRKHALTRLLRKPPGAIRLSASLGRGGQPLLREVSQMGFDGIVSKPRGSPYLSGRSPDWLFSRKMPRSGAL
jgi:bifunctional non-homologous end joining protein LigD